MANNNIEMSSRPASTKNSRVVVLHTKAVTNEQGVQATEVAAASTESSSLLGQQDQQELFPIYSTPPIGGDGECPAAVAAG